MDSSSDDFDTFAWVTDTDCSSGDNAVIANMNGDGEDSDYGKKYKKKLQKRLFKEESTARVKRESASSPDSERARSDSLLRARVKEEGAADCAASRDLTLDLKKIKKEQRKKKKSKRTESETGVVSDSENFVIEEKFTAEETVVSRPRDRGDSEGQVTSQLSFNSVSYLNSADGFVKRRQSQSSSSDEAPAETSRRKSSSNQKTNNHIIKDKFTAEETVVSPPRDPGSSGGQALSQLSSNSASYNNSTVGFLKCSQSQSSDSDEPPEVSNHRKSSSYLKTNSQIRHTSQECDDEVHPRVKDVSKQSPKLSDTIQFEDNFNVENCDNPKRHIYSIQLTRLLKFNPLLKALPIESHTGTKVTSEDEIWLMRCPRDIDIEHLENCDMVLDSKSKMKIDGQTYDGFVEEELSNVTILTFEHKKSIIKNVPVSGAIQFRKRVPKAHVYCENTITNNQTSFIPLPDTKCRHPLFGSDYKRAIKIPAAVRARLRVPEDLDISNGIMESKKKKRKREKKFSELMQLEANTKVEPELTAKSKRKRKLSIADEPKPKKSKRSKNDFGSAETWDSEKAIEEQLFNF